MKKISLWKRILLVALLVVAASGGIFASCETQTTKTQQDIVATVNIGNKQVEMQPTPTDLGPSITRYLLIRRAYWLNGDFGKALSVPCPVPNLPIVYLDIYSHGNFIKTVACVGGAVSRDTYLTPDSEHFEGATRRESTISTAGKIDTSSSNYQYVNNWLPDVDGTFGTNGGGIFYFTLDGEMRELTDGFDVETRSTPYEYLSLAQYEAFVNGGKK